MQAPLLLQPPPLLALAQQQVNQTRPRVSQHFLFHDLSSLLDPPHPMTVDNDHDYSSQPAGTNYTYTSSRTQFDEGSHSDPHNLYDVASSSHTPQPYTSLPNTSPTSNYTSVSNTRTAEDISSVNGTRYVSGSPSSVDDHPTASFPQPYSAPHHQHHFPTSASSYSPPDMVRYPITSNLSSRGTDKYAHALLEQRRMSEPAMYGSAIGGYSTSSSADLASGRYQQLQHHYTSSQSSPRLYGSYASSLQRTLSSGSVRDPLSGSSWNNKDQLSLHCYDGVDLEEPISPLNPNFSGGEGSPTMGMPYGSLSEEYGPSPPGTGTSTSSNGARRFVDASGSSSDGKQYSFVALPGNAVKKRPRRRYDEIERLYQCSWPSCTKAYGTLNHLNAHVTMQKHGVKRSPNEFKELRKQWRKSKKEEADARAAASAVMGRSAHHAYLSRGMHDSYADVDYQLRSHPQQGSHVDRFTPTASPEEMHDIDMQDVYERRQQRFSGLFPSTSRTSSPTYTATHSSNMPSSHTAMARLPTNSTLLTPLPGYEHAGATTDLNTYASYGVYPDNRPSSGHGSIGSYDETRRSG